MSYQERKKGIAEVTWPVGPDGTFRTYGVDPMGMYTGVPEIPLEKPVQDADDL